jgi:uracil-DNA glycosylase
MGGVSQIARYLVDETEISLYSLQFALSNAVKCVRATDNQKSTSNGTMAMNCAKHLKKEIELLSPDLVITQGGHPATTMLDMYKWCLDKEFKGFLNQTAAVWLNGGPFVLLTTPHPARQKGWPTSSRDAEALPLFMRQAIDHAKLAVYQRH